MSLVQKLHRCADCPYCEDVGSLLVISSSGLSKACSDNCTPDHHDRYNIICRTFLLAVIKVSKGYVPLNINV